MSGLTAFWDSLIDCIVRPPRDTYEVEDLVGGTRGKFSVYKFGGHRHDVTLTNKKGLKLQCSHYIPDGVQGEDDKLPCVVYCHCNSGSRRDAEEAVCILIPLGVSVFALDFAGSGLSEGQWVTLGAEEVEDVEVAVAYLRASGKVSTMGLWGRSMGAVTTLLYSRRDPSIAGIVVDSPFSRLTELMLEIVEEQKLPIPKPFAKIALAAMKRSVKKRAGFDICSLAPLDMVSQSYIPVLFGHATGDSFIKICHSEKLHAAYAGDKNLIRFEGDHNSRRPEFFYNSVSIFFHNTLQLERMLKGGNRLNSEVIRNLNTHHGSGEGVASLRLLGSGGGATGHGSSPPWTPDLSLVREELRRDSLSGGSILAPSPGRPDVRLGSPPCSNRTSASGAAVAGSAAPAAAAATAAAAAGRTGNGAIHPPPRPSFSQPTTEEEEEAQLMAAIHMSLLEARGAAAAAGKAEAPAAAGTQQQQQQQQQAAHAAAAAAASAEAPLRSSSREQQQWREWQESVSRCNSYASRAAPGAALAGASQAPPGSQAGSWHPHLPTSADEEEAMLLQALQLSLQEAPAGPATAAPAAAAALPQPQAPPPTTAAPAAGGMEQVAAAASAAAAPGQLGKRPLPPHPTAAGPAAPVRISANGTAVAVAVQQQQQPHATAAPGDTDYVAQLVMELGDGLTRSPQPKQ